MTKIVSKRISTGSYRVYDTKNIYWAISVYKSPVGWTATARWNRNFHSDPCATKKEAMEYAVDMLNTVYNS